MYILSAHVLYTRKVMFTRIVYIVWLWLYNEYAHKKYEKPRTYNVRGTIIQLTQTF